MGRCKRPRTREFAPTNSGSLRKPERINLRCTTEQCGRAMSAVAAARAVRAWRYGSAAERASASVYLEEFVRREDYVRNRVHKYQQEFRFNI